MYLFVLKVYVYIYMRAGCLKDRNGPEACLRKALRAAEDAGLDADDLKVGVDVSGQLKLKVDVVRSSRTKLKEFRLFWEPANNSPPSRYLLNQLR